MVRIVNNEPAQKELTEEAKITLGLLGVVIADHPEKVRKLLRDFGIETREKPTGRELTHKVLYAIDKKGSRFHLELAQLIADKLPSQGKTNSSGKQSQEDSFAGAIAGAVGAIATTIGSISGKKQKQREASQQTLSTMLAYKAQQEQLAAQQASQAQAHANKMAWLKGVGILVVVGLVGWGLVKMANQQPQAKQALT